MSVYWSTRKIKSNKNYVVVRHPLKFNGNQLIGGIKFCAGCGVAAEGSKELLKLLRMPMFRKAKILPLSFLRKVGLKPKQIQLIYGYDIYYHYLEAMNLGVNLKPIPKEDTTIAVTPDFVNEVKTSLKKDLEEERKQLDDVLEKAVEEGESGGESTALTVTTDAPVEDTAVEQVSEPVAEEETKEEEVSTLPELTAKEIADVHYEEGLCIRILSDGTVCENKRSKGSPSGYCIGHIRYDTERKNYGKKERRTRKKKKEEA